MNYGIFHRDNIQGSSLIIAHTRFRGRGGHTDFAENASKVNENAAKRKGIIAGTGRN